MEYMIYEWITVVQFISKTSTSETICDEKNIWFAHLLNRLYKLKANDSKYENNRAQLQQKIYLH